MFIVHKEMFLTGEVAIRVNVLVVVSQSVPQLPVSWSAPMDSRKMKWVVIRANVLNNLNALLLYAECIVNMVFVLTKMDVIFVNVQVHLALHQISMVVQV